MVEVCLLFCLVHLLFQRDTRCKLQLLEVVNTFMFELREVLTPFRINTRTHSNVRREEAARCSASCVDWSLGAVRPVAAGRTVTKPTNVSPGRPVGAGAHRIVLGSAGHLERPQSM